MRLPRSCAVALLAAISPPLAACGDDQRQPRRGAPYSAPSAALVDRGSARSDIAAARAVAQEFLRGYLPYLYGRGSPARVPHVSATVGRGLARARARETLAQRRRRPRVLELRLDAQRGDALIATALVSDGGPAPYPLTFTLVRRGGRWLVNALGSD
jgi:hypothetical protein